MRHLVCICVFALTLLACQQPPPPPSAISMAPPSPPPAPVRQLTQPTRNGLFSPAITAEDFAAHVEKLASNAFEGRKPGTLGEQLTKTYLKEHFERMGLKPGNNASYFQTVPMVETTLLDPNNVTISLKASQGQDRFAYKTDMMIGALDASVEVDVQDSSLVFVGYGVNAPEYQWNDYADLDVKGKTVIVLVNDPGWGNQDSSLFKGRAMTYYGRWTYKYEEAARQGAAACFIVHETAAAAYPWDVVVNSWSGPQQSLPPSEDPAPRLKVAGWLTAEATQRLFIKAGLSFDELKKTADLRDFKPADLKASLSVSFKNQIRNDSSDNVLAYLPGSKRPDEVIIYSAHWDHLGKDGDGSGDHIFNGAIDNSSGIAGLLEIAEAFTHQQPPPERSVLFLAVTLEESGLLGSNYYVTHPVFPIAKTVADINMDALPIIGRAHDIAVISYGHSDMDEYIKAAAASAGRTVVPDETPEKGSFFRGDQLNFARIGVPVLDARSGLNLLNGGEAAGRKAAADYTANRYHKQGDEFDPEWDFSGVIEDVQAFYAVGKKLSNETTFPQWKPDSEFHRPSAETPPAVH